MQCCNALKCKIPVPHNAIMCHRHWSMTPRSLQERILSGDQVSQQDAIKEAQRILLQKEGIFK